MSSDEEKNQPNNEEIITNLCFSGACNRGISYLGFLKKIQSKKINLKSAIGVSIGSFILALYILGYSMDDFLLDVIRADLSDMKDYTFKEKYSILKGESYKNWIYKLLEKVINPNISLIDLYNKTQIDFTIVAVSLDGDGKIIYFNHSNYPNTSLFTCICASTAIPLIFPPVKYNDMTLVDGSVLDGFPLKLLKESAKKYPGLSLGVTTTFKQTECENIIMFAGKIVDLMSKHLKYIEEDDETIRVIKINTDDFDLLNFNINEDDKVTLFMRGYNSIY